jgi:hypothetical protein
VHFVSEVRAVGGRGGRLLGERVQARDMARLSVLCCCRCCWGLGLRCSPLGEPGRVYLSSPQDPYLLFRPTTIPPGIDATAWLRVVLIDACVLRAAALAKVRDAGMVAAPGS